MHAYWHANNNCIYVYAYIDICKFKQNEYILVVHNNSRANIQLLYSISNNFNLINNDNNNNNNNNNNNALVIARNKNNTN